jgi:hypothetical protein
MSTGDESKPRVLNVVVVGDVNLDILIVPIPQMESRPATAPAPETIKRYRRFIRDGGALLLSKTIKIAVGGLWGNPENRALSEHLAVHSYDPLDESYEYQTDKRHPGPDELFLQATADWRCREALTTLALFPKKRSKEKESVYREKDSVYRIDEVVGWIEDTEADSSKLEKTHPKWLKKHLEELNQRLSGKFSAEFNRPDRPRIIVINDRDHGYRDLDTETSLKPFIPKAAKKGDEEGARSSAYAIVLEMEKRSQLAKNKLWDEIAANHKDRTVVVVSVESLREAGLNISDSASIEQLVEDFRDQLDRPDSLLAELAKCRHLVVWFRDGAIHHDNKRRGLITDYFCPYGADDPGSMNLGSMAGYTTILVASIVRGIACSMCGGADFDKIALDGEPKVQTDDLAGVKAGIGLGVVLCRQHFTTGISPIGFLTEVSPNFRPNPHPFQQLFVEYDNRKPESDKDQPELFLSRLEFETTDRPKSEEWGRIKRLLKLRNQKSWDVARDIVTRGLKYVAEVSESSNGGGGLPPGPYFPIRRILCPYGRFGVIETVDRDELDSYMSLCAVMRKYLVEKDWQTPLAIAVFGPPGSGKSFAIQQILEKVAPGLEKNSLEFNVAQFSSVKDLATACHQAQDRALASEVPLVTFDEFDANLGPDRLGWLKYFLAPMQNGKFKAGESMYRIGRAIFVFSGGTEHSFDEFAAKCRNDPIVRAAKGPDFLSRLRGHLSVKGIDSKAGVDDILKIRRAILLRSILKRKCSYIFDPATDRASIHEAVIHAFLNVARYKHGVRSMEAIVEMSQVSRSRGYLKASLPTRKQLELHVNATEFIDYLDQSPGADPPDPGPDPASLCTVFYADPSEGRNPNERA